MFHISEVLKNVYHETNLNHAPELWYQYAAFVFRQTLVDDISHNFHALGYLSLNGRLVLNKSLIGIEQEVNDFLEFTRSYI